jgi:hypothetical protein
VRLEGRKKEKKSEKKRGERKKGYFPNHPV